MRSLERPVCFEKPLLVEGEPLSFTLYSLTSNGGLEEREIKTTIEASAEGGFRGNVFFLEGEPFVLKTSRPTKKKYGISFYFGRSLHSGFRPFPFEHFERAVQLEHVGQKILRLLVSGCLGEKYYLPETPGYTSLPGIGFCHAIEEINFTRPHLPDEIERIFQAQEELTSFCREFGLVEISGQIHQDNPLAPPNLVFLEDGTVCWLDTHSGMWMRKSGYIPPIFYIPVFRKICLQTLEDGEEPPALNRIHTAVCTEAIIKHRAHLEANIGPEGYKKLRQWLALYGSLLTDYDEIRSLSRREQWQRAWREAPEVPGEIIDRIEEYPELYLLARVFGIRTVTLLLDRKYRQWALNLPERLKREWERTKKQEAARLRQEGRIGPRQEIKSPLGLILNKTARRIPLFPASAQRLINDPEFRSLSKLAGHLFLSGMRNAQKEKVLSISNLEVIEEQLLEQLTDRRVVALLLTAVLHQAVAQGANYFELGSYLAALVTRRPDKALVGFAGGWAAPVLIRLALTKAIQSLSQEEMPTAFLLTHYPKFGHYAAIPAQLAVDLKNPEIIEYMIRNITAKATSLWPTGGWGTRLELKTWRKIYPALDKMLRGGYPILERIEEGEPTHSIIISLCRERLREHS